MAAPAAGADEPPVDYLRDVKPALLMHCSSCHGGLMQNVGLRLGTAARALATAIGRAVVISSDRTRRALAGEGEPLRAPAPPDAGRYTPERVDAVEPAKGRSGR